MNSTTSAAVAITLALAAAACSDDAAALSKPEYISQADTICQAADEQIEPLFDNFYGDLEAQAIDPSAEPPPDSVFVGYRQLMGEMTVVWEEALGELRGLDAPAGDEDRLDRLFDDFAAALTEAGRVADAAAEGGGAERQALEDADPFHDVNARARVYGMLVCGAEE